MLWYKTGLHGSLPKSHSVLKPPTFEAFENHLYLRVNVATFFFLIFVLPFFGIEAINFT